MIDVAGPYWLGGCVVSYLYFLAFFPLVVAVEIMWRLHTFGIQKPNLPEFLGIRLTSGVSE